jgi:hypothetical protein
LTTYTLSRPDVPVIMITAYGDDDIKRKTIVSGAEGLLTKPLGFFAGADRHTTGTSRVTLLLGLSL